MAGINGRSEAPQTSTSEPAGQVSTAPDPVPVVPTVQSDFQQFPTTWPSTNSGVQESVTVKGPTPGQGATIALGIICGILLLGNLLFVLLYCLGQRYMDEEEASDAMISSRRRRHRSKKRKSRRIYNGPRTVAFEEKNSDLESLLDPGDHSRGFSKGPTVFRPARANVNPFPPAYFNGDQTRNLGRAQMQHPEKDNGSVDDPSDASVAGSSKYDEGHQMYGGRSSGSQQSSKSSRTKIPSHTRPRE